MHLCEELGKECERIAISLVLEVFNLSIFLRDQFNRCANSVSRVTEEFCGTMREVSSAYFK